MEATRCLGESSSFGSARLRNTSNIVKFWVVCKRPLDHNRCGLSPAGLLQLRYNLTWPICLLRRVDLNLKLRPALNLHRAQRVSGK